MSSLKKYGLFLVPTLLFLLLMAGMEWSIYQSTGRIVYPIDDPYIHFAMARHLAEQGLFGVSLLGYSASSSAPGWTLLLGATFFFTGSREWIPLVYNLLAGSAAILFLTWWFRRHLQKSGSAAAWAVAVVMILPLPAVVSLGMEHAIHILLIMAVVSRAMMILLDDLWDRRDGPLLLLTAAATTFRYETIFVAAPLCLLFFARGKWRQMVWLALAAALPIVLIGLFNLYHEWFFLPNSILLKSSLSGAETTPLNLGERLLGQLFDNTHLAVPFFMASAAFAYCLHREIGFSSEEGLLSFTFLVASILHCTLAALGWFYRYEAYLLALGAMALVPWATPAASFVRAAWNYSGYPSERILSRLFLVAAILFFSSLFAKNIGSIQRIVPGAQNLYSQQYQMGLFLREYYKNGTVVANDIGAINYLADLECLDIMGLGSIEPIRASRLDRWNSGFLDSWCRFRGAKIALVYDSWCSKILPPTWTKIGEWTVSEKVTVADTTVSFYAVDPQARESLHRNLQAFSSRLPDRVQSTLAEKEANP